LGFASAGILAVGEDVGGACKIMSLLPTDWKCERLKDVSAINEDSLPADTDPDYEFDYLKISNVDYQGILNFEACFPDSMVGFIPDHHLNRDFLYYLLVAIKPVLIRATVVTTQPNINYVQIGENYIPLPPVKEQAAIAEHIEGRIQIIREFCKSLESQIATLTAYRKSLIHECVTGQRRITEADLKKMRVDA
jgi:hypothetical protein